MKSEPDNSYTNFTQNLSPSARKWYATAIAGAVTSDGIVDDDELDFLKIAVSFLEDPNDINRIITLAKQRKVPKLSQLRNISRQDAFKILLALSKVVAADNVITKPEKSYIADAGGKLGFNKSLVKKLFDWLESSIDVNFQKHQVREKEKKMAKDLDKLFKVALNSVAEFS